MRAVHSLLWVGLFFHCAFATAEEPVDRQALAARAAQVLKAHCYRCHGQDGANEGGFNFTLDAQQLVQRRKVIAGEPGRSRLYKRLTSDDSAMPPDDEKVRPSKDEIASVRQWIEAGAPAFGTVAGERVTVTPAQIVERIRNDLRLRPERDRRFTRYFTLTHLHNAGLSADELQSYRHGLSKLVNSLSWGPRVVVPQAVDPERTIFRIDLRDYQWSASVWDAVLAANPYGVVLSGPDCTEIAREAQCRLPIVRGDWFVASAARPPLYHEVLELPATEPELQRLLRIDTTENIRRERVARAGFNGSGVSRNNRLIERHESGSVVYWKSCDFAGNTARRNLFAHPLGVGESEEPFEHDGGEIIFNLPNGLQAYFLTDGQGKRLDKGPVAIVSDPKRPDRAVENGLSCMSCHARGMLEKTDQVREHVLANAMSFARSDVESVRALYPPADSFTALLRKDARRFQQAVAETGAPWSVTEPIAALALRFEAEMDRALVAAEAGVSVERLLEGLARSDELGRRLGALRIEGGTVQRQVFVEVFPELVEILALGEHIPPAQLVVARLIREGDRHRQKGDGDAALRSYSEAVRLAPASATTWIARGDLLSERGQQTEAIADYDRALALEPRSALVHNNRGLAHRRKGDLERALADFTEALRLQPGLAAAYHNRGALHHTRGDLERAIADYTDAIRLEPSATAFNNRGYALFDQGQLDRALADFTRAIEMNPSFARARNNRGLVHSRKGNLREAVADFTAALEIDAKLAAAWYNRSIAYEKLGDVTRSRSDREQALRLDPTLDRE
jgi:tetratricopeptide (TPR) repeat protein/mono/diheme cytochrome c family protein